MATPRKHWFKVADSVVHEGWSNDVLATFIRLCGHLNTRWARDVRTPEESCRDLLHFGDLMQITGKSSFAAGVEALCALAEHVSIEVEVLGTQPVVYFAQRADGLIKIGQTGNWPTRKTQIEAEHGPVQFISAIKNVDGRSLERRLHRDLATDRVEGEWFRDTDAVRTWAAHGTNAEHELAVRGQYKKHPMVRVFWPKWAEYQGHTSRELPESFPRVSRELPSPTPTPTPTPELRKEPPVVPLSGDPAPLPLERTASEGKRRKRPPKQPGTYAPEALSPEQHAKLLRWAREKEPWAVNQLDGLVTRCLDHFRANGRPMVDWVATCRNWVTDQRVRFGGLKSVSTGPSPPAPLLPEWRTDMTPEEKREYAARIREHQNRQAEARR